jgi:hypothetical protein
VPAQKPVEIGSAYSVTPISMWNVQGTGSTQSWTMDGPLLQRIIFSVDTDYGQPIIRISNQNADDSLPTFSEGSSPIELIEGLSNSLQKLGFVKMEITKSDSVTLQGIPTIRVDFRAATASSPWYRGIGYVTQKDNKLHVTVFYGTELYHFEKSRAEFINMMSALTWTPTS